jgi:hypothetical protein
MEAMKWKDVSSYSKSDKERVPKTFEIRADDGIVIIVTRWVSGDPTRWYFICPAVACNIHRELSNLELEDAKREALWRVYDLLVKRVKAIEKLMKETP